MLIADAVEAIADPDSVRAPKSRLATLTAERTTYRESRDPASLAALIDPAVVFRRSRSFRRLVSALRHLAARAGDAAVTP